MNLLQIEVSGTLHLESFKIANCPKIKKLSFEKCPKFCNLLISDSLNECCELKLTDCMSFSDTNLQQVIDDKNKRLPNIKGLILTECNSIFSPRIVFGQNKSFYVW